MKLLSDFIFTIAFIAVLTVIFDFGYDHSSKETSLIKKLYIFTLFLGLFSTFIHHLKSSFKIRIKVLTLDFIITFLILFVFVKHVFLLKNEILDVLNHANWVRISIILMFIRELSSRTINIKRTYLNPAQLFVFSFLLIIFSGAFLLMLPNATYDKLSFLDALFTSTSAVCVTGLIVVDTATYFTEFGQFIVLILIQIGGLGILTFASYFSYFFKGGTSYESQLALSDITNSQKIGEVFTLLKRIILITFVVEAVSAFFIYLSLENQLQYSFNQKIFFSIFHAVSAFCNAGFSTLSNGLYEGNFQFNYSLQLIIILTFFLGGLGFTIISNLFKYIRYKITNVYLNFKNKSNKHIPWVINLNSRISLITTLSLVVFGTILFYFSEYNNTLKNHEGFGKFVTALFGATTPRTAGFNTIDMTAMSFSTTILVIFLMWIGASPMSTGGGIKTSTFAVATMNFISLARGKTRIEIFRRKIADISVRRAFATISLSLMVIGFGIYLMAIFDPDKNLLNIAFECFSAYSTVGLSIGLTPNLSEGSKIVLIVIMFIGRVSMLSILIAFTRKVKQTNYMYPTEEILIN